MENTEFYVIIKYSFLRKVPSFKPKRSIEVITLKTVEEIRVIVTADRTLKMRENADTGDISRGIQVVTQPQFWFRIIT